MYSMRQRIDLPASRTSRLHTLKVHWSLQYLPTSYSNCFAASSQVIYVDISFCKWLQATRIWYARCMQLTPTVVDYIPPDSNTCRTMTLRRKTASWRKGRDKLEMIITDENMTINTRDNPKSYCSWRIRMMLMFKVFKWSENSRI